MLTWFRRRLRRRRIQPRIELIPDGFDTVGSEGERYPVRWALVSKIATYKRDLLTTDEILLSFEQADHPGMVQLVSEEWTGFTDLFQAMEQHLGISPAWYVEVMKPAFARNFRVLYERPNSTTSGSPSEVAGQRTLTGAVW